MQENLGTRILMILAANLAAGGAQFLAWRFTVVGRVGAFGLYLIVLACTFALFGFDIGQRFLAVMVLAGLGVLLLSLRAPFDRTLIGRAKRGGP